MKKFDYNNKVAIITGASSGIGYGIASELIRKYGCTVYGIARNEQRLNQAKEELGEDFIPYPMDVSLEQSWQNLKEYFLKEGISPHILINCAGVLPEFASFQNSTDNELSRAMQINFMSCVYSCKQIMSIMKKGGLVANVSSASALCPFAGVSAYSASKAALERFSECLSVESKDITVSCVMPGFVRTDIMKSQSLNERERKIINLFSQKRDKAVRKILRRLKRRKRRIVVGKDAHFMSIMYRLFPRLTPRLITWVLKKSGLELFKKV